MDIVSRTVIRLETGKEIILEEFLEKLPINDHTSILEKDHYSRIEEGLLREISREIRS